MHQSLRALILLFPALLCAQTTPVVPAGLIYQAAATRGIQYIQPTAGQAIINQRATLNWHNLIINAVGVGSMAAVTGGVTGLVHMSTSVLGGFAVGHTVWDAYGEPLLRAGAPNPNDIAPPLQITGTVAPSAGACVEYSMFASGFAQTGAVTAKHGRFAATAAVSGTVSVGGLLVSFTPQGVQVLRNISGGKISEFEVVDVVACAPSLPVVTSPAFGVGGQGLYIPTAPSYPPGSIVPNTIPLPPPQIQQAQPDPRGNNWNTGTTTLTTNTFAIHADAPLIVDATPPVQPNGYACWRDSGNTLFCKNAQGMVFAPQITEVPPPTGVIKGSCGCAGSLEACAKACAEQIPVSRDWRELPVRAVSRQTSIQLYDKLVQLKPMQATVKESLEVLGRRLTSEGKYAEAIAVLEQSVRAHPDTATSWNALGYAYLLQRQYSAAAQALDRAIQIQPGYSNAGLLRGIVASRMKVI